MRSTIRRRCGETLTGSKEQVLRFARRAAIHLHHTGVISVEAWSVGELEASDDDFSGMVTFKIRPHRNGRDWTADGNELHHGGRFRSLGGAIDYALFRGRTKLCVVQVLNREGKIERVILVDQTHHDGCPCVAPAQRKARIAEQNTA